MVHVSEHISGENSKDMAYEMKMTSLGTQAPLILSQRSVRVKFTCAETCAHLCKCACSFSLSHAHAWFKP